MDKAEKMEKLTKAKSKQITELEKEIEELNNEIRDLTIECNLNKEMLEKAKTTIHELNGKNKGLTMALRIITKNERYYGPKIELPKTSEECFD